VPGSRTAQEFEVAWNELATEARIDAGEEPSGPLSVAVAEAGGTSIDGSIRSKVVQPKEEMRHKLLTRALATYPDRDTRPVMVFLNVADDKCTGRWLLATPSPDLRMLKAVFQ
jgi:hypothetical protein